MLITFRRYYKISNYRNECSNNGKSWTVTARNIFQLQRCLFWTVGCTNKSLFADAGIEIAFKATINSVRGSFRKKGKTCVQDSVDTQTQNKPKWKWGKIYMKTDIHHILFNENWWTTINGPGVWDKERVFYDDTAHVYLRYQQGNWEGVLKTGIMRARIITPFKEPEEMEINAALVDMS